MLHCQTKASNKKKHTSEEVSPIQGKDTGFKGTLTVQAVSPSNYDEEIIVASVDKVHDFLFNRIHIKNVKTNYVDKTLVAVKWIVKSIIPTAAETLSNLIGWDFTTISLASFNLRIINAIIFTPIALSIKVCNTSYPWVENCSAKCLVLGYLKFNYKVINSFDKILL